MLPHRFFPDQLVTEKEGGVLERELSTGITILQLLVSQMLTQCLVKEDFFAFLQYSKKCDSVLSGKVAFL